MKHNFVVDEIFSGTRIDKFLTENIPDRSRSFIASNIESGNVSVNGKVVSKSFKVSAHDNVTLELDEIIELEAIPQDIPLDIVYEDDDIIVVNKP
ncbi:MAG: S4 domain-containing protein, partial [Eubacteriales bacterium]|nr:S4 domain-containing protein [Eubacteriales bacterium]